MTNERMQAAIKELEETAIVMSHIQAKQSEYLKDHIEWLHSHDLAMARHDREMAEARERDKELGERISALVSGIGEFMRRDK
jgi:hypothetical protein